MNGAVAGEKVVTDAALRVRSPLPWLALGDAATAVLALYAPVIAGMAAEWSEFPSLSHGFAVPFLSAYLLWTRRHLFAEAPIEGSLWGLPLIVLAVAMLVIGSLGAEPFAGARSDKNRPGRAVVPITGRGATVRHYHPPVLPLR